MSPSQEAAVKLCKVLISRRRELGEKTIAPLRKLHVSDLLWSHFKENSAIFLKEMTVSCQVNHLIFSRTKILD
jgi:hypothetical protein